MSTYPAVLDKVRRRREKDAAKHSLLVRKQDKLLFVGFYILLNLAEDMTVEKKMVKKQLIPSLAVTLGGFISYFFGCFSVLYFYCLLMLFLSCVGEQNLVFASMC